MKPIRQKIIVRTGQRFSFLFFAGAFAFVLGCGSTPLVTPLPADTAAPPMATLAPTETPIVPTARPTDAPPSPTPETPTAQPISIFGEWTVLPGTTAILLDQPKGNLSCMTGSDQWPPVIIIRPTGNPGTANVSGLHEHVDSEDLPLNAATMTLKDTKPMPDINQTLIVTIQLLVDGRLYYQEENLLGDEVCCSASVYYVRSGD